MIVIVCQLDELKKVQFVMYCPIQQKGTNLKLEKKLTKLGTNNISYPIGLNPTQRGCDSRE